MTNPDKNEMFAIVKLKSDADFNIFINFLRNELEKERKTSDYLLDDVALRMSQGKRQVINELLELFEKSEKYLKKMERRESDEYL